MTSKRLKQFKKLENYYMNNTFIFPHSVPPKYADLRLENVTFGYPDQEPLFENVNLNVNASSRIAILGANGIGKSTLLNVLYGTITPTLGQVTKDQRLRLAKYNQHNYDQLNYAQSGVEYLTNKHHLSRQNAHRMLGIFGLPSRVHRSYIHQLSGGEKAKVCLADVACSNPSIMLLDEPTANLDVFSVESLVEAINKFRGGLVLITHDQMLLSDTNCKLFVLDNKQLKEFHGNIHDYREMILSEIRAQESDFV